LIEHVARALVDQPNEVSVHEVEEPQEIVLELEVSPDEVGKVIGRQGRTARALRNLLSAATLGSEKSYELEILE
jgi:predicted RNA-binding protein YlqC (UPF0109 family)